MKLTESLTLQGEFQFEIWLKEDEESRELNRGDAVEKIYRVRGHNFIKNFSVNQPFVPKIRNLSWEWVSKECGVQGAKSQSIRDATSWF